MGPSRAAAKAETREALLSAGVEEFAEHGIDAPSLDSICARAGYTRGAFYVHFRSRDDFLVAVMERFLGAFLDTVIATGDEENDLEETVTRFAEVLSLRNVDGVPFHRVLEVCSRAPDFQARIAALLDEAVERMAKVADEGQAAGSVRADLDAGAVATLLVALALGVITALEAGLALDLPRVRDTVLRLLRAS
jgi:AcrR family transcriptional regulator